MFNRRKSALIYSFSVAFSVGLPASQSAFGVNEIANKLRNFDGMDMPVFVNGLARFIDREKVDVLNLDPNGVALLSLKTVPAQNNNQNDDDMVTCKLSNTRGDVVCVEVNDMEFAEFICNRANEYQERFKNRVKDLKAKLQGLHGKFIAINVDDLAKLFGEKLLISWGVYESDKLSNEFDELSLEVCVPKSDMMMPWCNLYKGNEVLIYGIDIKSKNLADMIVKYNEDKLLAAAKQAFDRCIRFYKLGDTEVLVFDDLKFGKEWSGADISSDTIKECVERKIKETNKINDDIFLAARDCSARYIAASK